VRTRQRRGLELLRAKLDATHTSRTEWLAALASLARSSRSAATAGAAGALVWKMLLAAAIVVVGWRMLSEEHAMTPPSTALSAPSGESLATSTPDAASGATPTGAADSAGAQRDAIQAPYPPKHPPAPASTVDAQLLDLKGQPFVGLEVEYRLEHEPHWQADGLDIGDEVIGMNENVRKLFESSPREVERFLEQFPGRPGLREVMLGQPPPRPRAVSDASGRIHLALPEGTWKRFVVGERFAILTEIQPERVAVPHWVIAPCIHIAGTVVDEEGAPVQAANVQGSTHIEDLALFGGESGGEYQSSYASCDAQGRFDVACTPITPELDATVYAAGFESRNLPALTHDDLALRVVMKRTKAEVRPHVRGVVVDENGSPVPKASILFGQNGGLSDEHGTFDLEVGYSQPGEPLQAVKRGFQPAVIPDLGQYGFKTIEDVVLRLGPAALSIEGRVLDRGGAAVAGAHVQLIDGTPAGTHSAYLEDVVDDRWHVGVQADADGHFTLGGLSARTYRVMAWKEKRGLIAVSAPIAAGSTDVVLRASPSAFQELLTGRVVTRRGVPLENVEVTVELPTFVSRSHSQFTACGRVSTDAAGHFELHDVPLELVQLWVSGRAIHTDSFQLPIPRTDSVEVTAAIEMRVHLEVADAAVDHVTFLDESGKVATVEAHFPHTESQQYEITRVEGSFAEFSLTDEVATIVLKHGDTELRRVPLDVRREARVTLQL
jgi:protocatechuate 3,4-dioxygenase beta subunit